MWYYAGILYACDFDEFDSYSTAIGSIIQIGLAMKKMAKNMIHGDLKPDNIFVNKNGKVKISDIDNVTIKSGIAETENNSYTKIYKQPENDDNNIEKADIYSFGIIMISLLTDKTIYDIRDIVENNPNKDIILSENDLDLNKIFSYIKENDDGEYNQVFSNFLPEQEKKIKTILLDLVNGCIKYDYKERYSIDDVLKKLRDLTKYLEKINFDIKNKLKLDDKCINELKINEDNLRDKWEKFKDKIYALSYYEENQGDEITDEITDYPFIKTIFSEEIEGTILKCTWPSYTEVLEYFDNLKDLDDYNPSDIQPKLDALKDFCNTLSYNDPKEKEYKTMYDRRYYIILSLKNRLEELQLQKKELELEKQNVEDLKYKEKEEKEDEKKIKNTNNDNIFLTPSIQINFAERQISNTNKEDNKAVKNSEKGEVKDHNELVKANDINISTAPRVYRSWISKNYNRLIEKQNIVHNRPKDWIGIISRF